MTAEGICWGSLGLAVAALCGPGCGGTSGSSAAASSSMGTSGLDAAPPGDYLPLSVGMSWSYNITGSSGASGQGTIVVEAAENAPLSGQSGLRVHTTLLDSGTLAWEQSTGTSVVRYEQQQLSQTGSVVLDT